MEFLHAVHRLPGASPCERGERPTGQPAGKASAASWGPDREDERVEHRPSGKPGPQLGIAMTQLLCLSFPAPKGDDEGHWQGAARRRSWLPSLPRGLGRGPWVCFRRTHVVVHPHSGAYVVESAFLTCPWGCGASPEGCTKRKAGLPELETFSSWSSPEPQGHEGHT